MDVVNLRNLLQIMALWMAGVTVLATGQASFATPTAWDGNPIMKCRQQATDEPLTFILSRGDAGMDFAVIRDDGSKALERTGLQCKFTMEEGRIFKCYYLDSDISYVMSEGSAGLDLTEYYKNATSLNIQVTGLRNCHFD